MQAPIRNIASIYNPDLLTKEQLINSFVVRVKKFEKVMADLRIATMEKPEQPIMLVGLRGMGKTTLLRRIAYEVENDPDLNRWLIPIIFNEEEYGITTLFKLWETIAEYLAKRDPAFLDLYEQMDAAHRRDSDRHRYEQKAFDILLTALQARGKKLLLIIDNFGDMFKRFNKQEKQRLREIMMTCTDLRVIAASAMVLEAFVKYDDPLYEFFKTERLDGLNREETEQLLLKLGEHLSGNPVREIIDRQPQRVEALRRVTGGIPRSIVFLFEIFINDKDGTAFTDLESILDRVTPLYKHRMDDLPTQQQEIMQALALHYDGMSAREVADRTRLDSKLVSAQLRQLNQAELVQTVGTHSKNHLYHVRDRFFNIWFLMRMARKSDRNRVLWLVRFLECWCDPGQLSKRTDAHRKALTGQGYEPRAAYYMSTALYYADQEDIDTRYQMARQTQHYLRERDPGFYTQIEQSDVAYFSKAIQAIQKRQFDDARLALATLKDKNAQDYLLLYVLEDRAGNQESAQKHYQSALSKGIAVPERLIGDIYWRRFKDADKAEHFLKAAVAKGDTKAFRPLGNIYRDKWKDFAQAESYYRSAIESGDHESWVNLGDLYCDRLKDYAQAEACYIKAAEEGHAVGWRYMGIMYADNLKKYPEAEGFFRKAIETGETFAWVNLGNLYCDNLKDYIQAEACYIKAAEEGHSVGWRYMGIMYANNLKKFPEAEGFFQKAIETGETFTWVHQGDIYRNVEKDYAQAETCYQKAAEEGHAVAWHYIGTMYESKLKKHLEAEEYYRKAIDEGYTYAWVNLGYLYCYNLKDYTQAESYYQKGVEEGHTDGWRYMGIMYADNLKKFSEAEEYYRKAIEGGKTFAWINLGNLYRNNLKDYAQAEVCYNKRAEEGNADGWRYLGIMYADNLKKFPEAEGFFRKAIEAGETFAWVNLGNFYRNVEKDYTQAEGCYKKAEEEGHADGWRNLGIMYADNLKKYPEAEEFYRKAIEGGETYAWANLGDLYRNNLKDYAQAEACYQKAAEEGHADGLRLLGIMYADNLKKYSEAETYYRKAIEGGETFAWINLGNLYRDNLKDYPQAEACYIKAEEEGHAIGWRYLGIMYADNLKKYPEAEAFYRKAVDGGETFAWFNLGNLYCDNLKAYIQAEACYKKAAEEGHAVGWRYIGNLYSEDLNDLEKAVCFYNKAIEMGNNEAYNSLSWALFSHKSQRENAYTAAEKAYQHLKEPYIAHTLACAALWNEYFDRAHEVATLFLHDAEVIADRFNNDDWLQYFLLLLAKSQYSFLYQYFTSEEGKAVNSRERLTPFWYALTYYMKEEQPLEYLRMPPELNETVQEIIAKVEQYRKEYAIKSESLVYCGRLVSKTSF